VHAGWCSPRTSNPAGRSSGEKWQVVASLFATTYGKPRLVAGSGNRHLNRHQNRHQAAGRKEGEAVQAWRAWPRKLTVNASRLERTRWRGGASHTHLELFFPAPRSFVRYWHLVYASPRLEGVMVPDRPEANKRRKRLSSSTVQGYIERAPPAPAASF